MMLHLALLEVRLWPWLEPVYMIARVEKAVDVWLARRYVLL